MARVYERKEIDLQRAYALLAEGKTQEEVARILGIGERTLQRRLREEKEEHSGVPARTPRQKIPEVHRGTPNGTPQVPPSTPWLEELASLWPELKALVDERRSRQRLLSISPDTPRQTKKKKTYAMDPLYIGLIQRYADLEHLDYADVVGMAFREFFEQRGYLPTDA